MIEGGHDADEMAMATRMSTRWTSEEEKKDREEKRR